MKFVIKLLLLTLAILSLSRGAQGQCLSPSTPLKPGFCDDITDTCDNKNANVFPDFLTPMYDYRIFPVSGFRQAQKIGCIGTDPNEIQSLTLNAYLPVNNTGKKPVILYSPLSSFTFAVTGVPLTKHLGEYFATRGFIFIEYSSRTLAARRSTLQPTDEITDYVTNPYYTSDSVVIKDFVRWRDSTLSPTYGFFDFLAALSKSVDGEQKVSDLLTEAMFKTSYDTKYLMSQLEANSVSFKFDTDLVFLMGASAGAVQSLHAGLLNHPTEMDSGWANMLPYHGLSHPNPGSLSSDFVWEPAVVHNYNPKGIVNLWGYLTNLDVIDTGDAALFSAQGTWDANFPFQFVDSDLLPSYTLGVGAEGIHSRARSMDLNTDIFIVCKGKHAMLPTFDMSCDIASAHEQSLFKDMMARLTIFMAEHSLGIQATSDQFSTNAGVYHATTPPPRTLIPPVNTLLVDSNDHCPLIYPEQFSTTIY